MKDQRPQCYKTDRKQISKSDLAAHSKTFSGEVVGSLC